MTVPSGILAASNAVRSHQQGIEALKRGNYDEAVRLISEAVKVSPDEARYYNDRGVAHKRAGRLDDALEDYSKALKLKPDYVYALNNRAVVYLEKGTYDRAIRDCTEALKHGEMLSKIYTNRGMAYAGMGDHAKAVADYQLAISHRPVDSRAFVFLAESLWKLGQKEQARQMFQVAQGLTKDSRNQADFKKHITRLEKLFSEGARSSDRSAPSTGPAAAAPKQPTVAAAPPVKKPADPPKEVAPAPSAPTKKEELLDRKPSEVRDTEALTPGQLNLRCLEKQVRKFSADTLETYRQARQYLEKADPYKALVRYEDSLQLAKKNRNPLGAAWINLEIGRVHLALGDHIKAMPYLGEAARAFVRQKATDETILAYIELASAKRAGGMARDAENFSANARNMALTSGYAKLAKVLDKLAAGTPVVSPRATRVASRHDGPASNQQTATAADRKQEATVQPVPIKRESGPSDSSTGKEHGRADAVQTAKLSRLPAAGAHSHLESIGRGPAAWAVTGNRRSPAGIEAGLSRTPLASLPRVAEPEKRTSAEREVFWVKRQAPQASPSPYPLPPGERVSEKSVREDLVLLEKLKMEKDEATMIPLLERLAEVYERQNKDEKALYALTASLGLREKLGRTDAVEGTLFKSGLLREKIGQKASALEDYARAAVLSRVHGKAEVAKAVNMKAKKLAKQTGLDRDAIVAVLEAIWEARLKGNDGLETQALHKIGTIYERAGQLREAESYYARSEASTLAQRATLLEKTGQSEQAQQFRAKAAQAFKKLDYSRYVYMLKKANRAHAHQDRKPSQPQAGTQAP